jgi:4-aminobutyrate aminotransferase/(S)-3-amino-2-methylpropionate transaminase
MTRLLPKSRLVTAIPGPKSLELQARRKGAVAAGVGSTLPAYIDSADDGLLIDVDGNQLIDLGSGIAVTTIGNASPRVAAARSWTTPPWSSRWSASRWTPATTASGTT